MGQAKKGERETDWNGEESGKEKEGEEMTADNLYAVLLQSHSREQTESLCRQVLSIIDREEIAEVQRLRAEQKTLLEKRRTKVEPEFLDDAPGFINR